MPILILVKFSRAFLSISYILAGYCLIKHYTNATINIKALPYVITSGFLLTLAEATWINIYLAKKHAKTNPTITQCLPGISTSIAFFIAAILTITGLMCAITSGFASFRIACLFLLITFSRAVLFKNLEIIDPIVAGLSRSLLLILGMSVYPVFMELFDAREIKLPILFLGIYIAIIEVLAQVERTASPRALPQGDVANNITATQILELREGEVDVIVLWFAGISLICVVLVSALVMPEQWVSWGLSILLVLILVFKLIPAAVYKSISDLNNFTSTALKCSAILAATFVASISHYYIQHIYKGWGLSIPILEELIGITTIILFSFPVLILKREYFL